MSRAREVLQALFPEDLSIRWLPHCRAEDGHGNLDEHFTTPVSLACVCFEDVPGSVKLLASGPAHVFESAQQKHHAFCACSTGWGFGVLGYVKMPSIR